MTLLILAHLALVRLHGVAPLPEDPRRETYPFFPDHMLREAIIGLFLLVCLVNYINFFPPTVGEPATPGNTPGHIRPEWYFFPTSLAQIDLSADRNRWQRPLCGRDVSVALY
jgi:quinol-cytochrome oxidoreductase complex cytochrome b subunit